MTMLKSPFNYLQQKPTEAANKKLEQGTDRTERKLQMLASYLKFEFTQMIF